MTKEPSDIKALPEICKSCEARHKGICSNLSDQDLLFLSTQTTIATYDKGTVLVSEDAGRDIHANILKGVVKLTKSQRNGDDQIVGLQFAPDFLGRPLSDIGSTNAVTASEVRLCEFPKGVLDDMMARSPGLKDLLFRQAIIELEEAREWMLTLGRRTAKQKVAAFLLLVADQSDPEAAQAATGPVDVPIPLSRAEVAEFLGIKIETVSRSFTTLREEGMIQDRAPRLITIVDIAALRDLVA